MPKYFRLVLLLLTAGVVLVSTLTIRLRFAEQPVRTFLESRTGLPVAYSSIAYQFPVRVIINDVRLGNTLACHTITITYNPFSFLSTRFMPSSLYTHIQCDQPRINHTPELEELLKKISANPLSGKSRYTIVWTDARVNKGTVTIISPSGFVNLDSFVTGRVFLSGLGHLVDARFSASPAEKGATGINATLNVSGPTLKGTVTLSGRYHDNGAVNMVVRIPSLYAGSWSVKNGNANMSVEGSMVNGQLNASGINLVVKNTPSGLHLTSLIDFSSLSKNASGTCAINVTKDAAGIHGTVAARNTRLPWLNCDHSDFYFEKSSSGAVTAHGTVFPASYVVNARYDPATGLVIACTDTKGGTANISGTLVPLKIVADVTHWQLTDNPISSTVYPGLKGTLGVQGTIGPAKTSISISADQWQLPGGRPQSFTALVRSYNDNWFASVFSSRQDVRLQGSRLANGRVSFKGSFNGILLSDVLPWLKSTIPLEGSVRGTMEYSSRGYGATALSVDSFHCGSAIQGTAVIDTHWNPERCEIRDFSIKNASGSVIVSGQIPFSSVGESPSLFISFHRFMVSHLCIDGALSLSGVLDTELHAFSGLIYGQKIHVNDHVFQSVCIPVRVGRARIEVINAALDSMMKATLFVDRIHHQLGGTIDYAGFPMSFIVPAMDGHAEGTVSVEGLLSRPHITVSGHIRDGRYKTIPFKAAGVIQLLNNSILTDAVKIITSTGQITVAGKLWPQTYASVRLTAVPVSVISSVISGDTSKKDIRGIISGTVTATPKGIFIDDALAKVADSELRFVKGSYVLFDSHTFDVSVDMRNVHAGGADIFGKLQTKGTWNSKQGQSDLNVTCTASNLWINQYMVSKLVVPLTVRDGLISFRPSKKQTLQVSGSVSVAHRHQLVCNKLLISSGEQTLVLTGDLTNNSVSMLLKGTSINGTLLSELTNLPVTVDGAVDFQCVAKGSLEQPAMQGSLSIKKGTIEELPFDELNTKFFLQHDVLTIEKAQLIKTHQYELTATGLIPFSLTEKGMKKALKQPMNLTINLDKADMSVLPSFISDIKSATGLISSQMRITGSLSRPVFDGFLKIIKGEVDERRYFGRLKDISLIVDMKNSLLSITDCRAKSGKGVMRVKGTIALSGLSPDKYAVTWFTEGARGISLVVPELPIPSPLIKNDEMRLFSNLSHGQPTFSLTLSGSSAHPLFSGWVDLENTRFTYPSIIKSSGDTVPKGFLSQLSMDLELRSGKNTWYDNELASVNIQGGIHLTGPFESPEVSGTVESAHGTISYFGTDFEITHASLDLVKSAAYIEGEATTEVYGNTSTDVSGNSTENDTITMIVDRSDFQHIKPRFVSLLNAMLTSDKALAKATGMDSQTYSNTSDQDNVMRQQLVRLFDNTLTTPLARSLLSKTGIADSFKVQYVNQQLIKPVQTGNPTMAELLYGTKYSMAKHVTNQLQLDYSVIFDELNNNLDLRPEFEMSYQLKGNTFLKGLYDLDTHNPLRQYDKRITLEQQWRFNLFGSHSAKKPDHKSTNTDNKTGYSELIEGK